MVARYTAISGDRVNRGHGDKTWKGSCAQLRPSACGEDKCLIALQEPNDVDADEYAGEHDDLV